MKHNIKGGHALINHRDGVSVELGEHQDTAAGYELVKTIVQDVGTKKDNVQELYEVYDAITEKGGYENFKLYKNAFIPILAGEVSYLAKNI